MMPQRKISVPAAVSLIITRNQPVYDCLKQKLINYHALAAKIKPEVDELTGRNTKVNTIVVGIKRFSDTIADIPVEEPLNILRDAHITLASHIVDVTIEAKKSEFPDILKQITEVSSSLNDPPHIFLLSNSIKLVTDVRHYETFVRSGLSEWHITKEEKALAKLSLHLPSKVKSTPGFASFVTELLYRSGIQILHTYIGEETILILDRKDGPRAYEILEREILRSARTDNTHPQTNSS